jgi:3-methyl-2-oxobutanoate hydroxymethyltransferase
MGHLSTLSIRKMKGHSKIVCTTAYDFGMATLADQAGVDLILVGDSLGMIMLGYQTTVPVTVEMMVHHASAVCRAKTNALVVIDVPFAVASHSFDYLLDACSRFMQECGADAVKIEGGEEFAPTIARLVDAGVPVMGHTGLLPQRSYVLGGYRRFGKTPEEKEQLLRDVRSLEKAGAFCVLTEMICHDIAHELRDAITVPLIGIGAGQDCDGQMLVSTDLTGLTQGPVPSFAKRYANLGDEAKRAFAAYAKEVREGIFPEKTVKIEKKP